MSFTLQDVSVTSGPDLGTALSAISGWELQFCTWEKGWRAGFCSRVGGAFQPGASTAYITHDLIYHLQGDRREGHLMDERSQQTHTVAITH